MKKYAEALEYLGHSKSAAAKAGLRDNHIADYRKRLPWFAELCEQAMENFRADVVTTAVDAMRGKGIYSRKGPQPVMLKKMLETHVDEFKPAERQGNISITFVSSVPQPKRIAELPIIDALSRVIDEDDEDEPA